MIGKEEEYEKDEKKTYENVRLRVQGPLMFFIKVSRLHLFDQKYSELRYIYSKSCNILKYYYNLIELFSNLIYFKMSLISEQS